MSVSKLSILLISSVLALPLSANEKNAIKDEKDTDAIVLQSHFIGDKEQPSVSYFIPWKRIGTPDKLQWQISDKVDRTLDLVDRKIMVRSTTIYQELNLEQKN